VEKKTGIDTRKVTGDDCVKCGACCVSEYDLDTYVDVEPHEAKLIPARMLLRRHGFSSLKTKETRLGYVVCTALMGSLGKRVRCAIYEHRPGVCRSFKPGSRPCLESRRELSLTRCLTQGTFDAP
jgi:Fe-S-cluster containining protein